MGKFLESQLAFQKNVLEKSVKSGQNLRKHVRKVDFKNQSSGKLKRKISETVKSGQATKKPKYDDNLLQESESEDPDEPSEEVQVEIRVSNVTFKQLEDSNDFVLSEDTENDLFCTDEYNGRYDQYIQFNFMFKIFDEIALEGLDGITLEALWKRLKHSFKYRTILDNIRDLIWEIICLDDRIKFYELPEPRGDLVIANNGIMTEAGNLVEVYIPNIYKFGLPPKDSKDLGSCTTYTTRKDITSAIRTKTYLEAYYEYGNKLAIVADQEMRSYALFDSLADPTRELISNEYCILEAVGRSRDIGELTHGISSINSKFDMDPRSTYYYKKHLALNKLIVAQKLIMRTLTDLTRTCQLLHLRRFYNERKSKLQLMTENVVNFLKTQPNYRITRKHLIERFSVSKNNLKHMINSQFSKYFSFSTVPYRVLYPEAKSSEYMIKNKGEERRIPVVELIDPYLNITCETKNDSSDDEDDPEENTDAIGTKAMNIDVIRDIYLSIWQKGQEGETIRELNSKFNLTFYTLRLMLRKLCLRKFVQAKKVDAGKTKLSAYVATCYLRENTAPLPNNKTTDTPKPAPTNSVLEKLKAKQQKAIESVETDNIYDANHFRKDQENTFETNVFLPVVHSVPDVKCIYLVTRYIIIPLSRNQFEDISKPSLHEVRASFNLRLGFLNYTPQDVIEINRLWRKFHEINEQLPLEIKYNIENVCERTRNMDELTMNFLLRALFEEIEIQKPDILKQLDTTGYFCNKNTESAVVEEVSKPAKSGGGLKQEAFNFMGNAPTTIFKETKDDIEIEILQSTLPKKDKIVNDIESYQPQWAVTDRTADRAKKIINIVREHRVVDEFCKLTREISVLEAKEGYDKKIDRKTFLRLLKNLTEDGMLKVLVLNLKKGDLVKTKNFVCALEESYLSSCIQSQIDQLVHKYFITKPVLKNAAIPPKIGTSVNLAGPSTQVEATPDLEIEGVKVKKSPFVVSDVLASISQLKELRKDVDMKEKMPKRDAYFARKYYGLRQKFVRMSILHEVLFYLIYEQPKDATQLSKSEIEELFRQHQINLSREDLDSLPPVYCKEISWKTFVPPLPTHLGWPEGWALVCDIILRLPLSILLKIFNCTFASYELVEVISHPIKRFFLLGYNSDHIKGILTQRRKFIFDIYHIICHLAYCGLVQFGPTKLFQKDQVFIYLNRKASLLKTVTSAPGYHKVEEKEYPRVNFTFNSIMDVQQYWSTMYEIGMNTKLNSFKAVKGRTITLYTSKTKPDLRQALMAKTTEEAIECDNGEIPGDQRGACGLDSSMWAHKATNWHSAGMTQRSLRSTLLQEKVGVQTKSIDYNNLQQMDRMLKKVFLPKKTVSTIPKNKRALLIRPKQKVADRHVRTVFHKGYTRKGQRSYYDHKDLAIVKRVRPSNGGRIKLKWTPEEDRILILLRVASILLSKSSASKQLISFITIRDVLHHIYPPSSKSKTSRAIQRRFKIIFDQYKELSKIEMNIPNLFKLEPIKLYIKPLVDQIDSNGLKLTPTQYSIAYLFLMSYISKNIREVESALNGAIVGRNDHLSNENIQSTVANILPFVQKNTAYVDPANLSNIIVDTLKATFIGALCCRALQNDSLWSYQLFSTYRKFKNIDIKQALDSLLSTHFISKRKFEKKSVMRFCLSTHYIYSQNSTYNFKIVEEIYKIFDDVVKNFRISIKDIRESHGPERLVLGEVATFWLANLSFKLSLPDYMLVLDPTMEDHSELIEELAKRYQIKMKNDLDLRSNKDTHDCDKQSTEPLTEIKSEPLDLDIIDITEEYDDEQSTDLTFKSGNTVNMTDLRNWIEGYSEDVARSRSPSPERLINREPVDNDGQDKDVQAQESSSECGGKCLSMAEIKEEMMKPPMSSSSKKRPVPYILDMIDLLSENFEEIESDESQREDFKKHFVAQFPVLEEFSVEESEQFKNHHLVRFLDDKLRSEGIWEKIRSSHIVGQATPLEKLYEIVLQNGGSHHDISLIEDIIGTVINKEFMGIPAVQLKEKFADSCENFTLEHLLTLLTSHNILIQTGVCSITFVYHLYKIPWLLNVPVMSDEEIQSIEKKIKSEPPQEQVEKIESNQSIDVRLFPWIRIDGALNSVVFKVWLTNVLSYSVENPKLWFRSLTEKYFMMKPVDLYFLLEILQELGCIKTWRYDSREADFFKQWEPSKEFLHSFGPLIWPGLPCNSSTYYGVEQYCFSSDSEPLKMAV